MRIRTIKPEFWTDSFFVQLPHLARLFFIALWSQADDHGFILDEPDRIAMEVMPREDPEVIDDWIQFFVASEKLERYTTDDGYTFLRVKNWEKHQRVDRPSASKINREPSRKLAIPLSERRAVAEKYGCRPGEEVAAECFYCGAAGKIHWHRLSSGRPSLWVTFPGLELDHVEPEVRGGNGESSNLVLSCRSCNRAKGSSRCGIETFKGFGGVSHGGLASPREASRMDQGSGIRDQGAGKGASHTRAHEGLAGWLGEHAGCVADLDYTTQLALWGLYGPSGTDERVWGQIQNGDRPKRLATAVLRWSSEKHERFNARLFRAILTTVLRDGDAPPDPYRPAQSAASEEADIQQKRERARRKGMDAETRAQLEIAEKHKRELLEAHNWLEAADVDAKMRVERLVESAVRKGGPIAKNKAFVEAALIQAVRAESTVSR